MERTLRAALTALCLTLLVPAQALANGGVCPRPPAGSEVLPPPDLYSDNGKLEASLNYFTSMDDEGRTLFCFVTTDGNLSPTLHVNPGDQLIIHFTNQIPASPGLRAEKDSNSDTQCGAASMTDSSANMHFHGLNVSPKCHSDETIFTLVNSGETFDYKLNIPKNEPPGLYWYHPHVHGIASPSVQGGATGVIEVEGIANIQPAVAGMPERFIVLRDQQFVEMPATNNYPFWDVSVNYVPVSYPKYIPAIIKMHNGTQEFWRVANAGANTIMDLQVKYDGVPQQLQIVAWDGVPTGSQDGKRQGTIVTDTHALLPPASRVEFIIAPPKKSVKSAILETETIDGGPASDSNPKRPLAAIQLTDNPKERLPRTAERTGPPNVQRFERLQDAKVTAKRVLYFSEIPSVLPKQVKDKRAGAPPVAEPVKFYITVEGEFLMLYDPNEPPAIITTQGAVEEWRIENRSPEVHEFHIHQIHFLVEEVDGVKIPKDQQQFYDTFQVPYWKGRGHYPYIKVRMDFRGAIDGDFLYHCHILDHEDGGMMAKIRVLPKTLEKL
jgi:FtsP/CotA-like multicopper oxidase with cupredoxin domain